MQKMIKDNIIFVDKPKMSLIPIALSAASLLFVILGAASLFYLQQPLQQEQDLRGQASVAGGQVVLTSAVADQPTFTAGKPIAIDLRYNSQGVQLTGIQIVTKVTANTETPRISVPADSNLQAIFQEVEQQSDGYLVSMIVVPRTVGSTFASTSPTTFAQIIVPLRAAGPVQLQYDKGNSFATVANTNPPRDELRTPEDVTFSIIAAASPSPSPSPSASPAVSPSPSPSPTPIPAGDDLWPVGSGLRLWFYTDDTERKELALAELAPNRTYRVRVQYLIQNWRKDSANNQTPITTAFVFNGQGSSFVTDRLPYSLISNHRDGAGGTIETRFTTQTENTLRITADATSAYTETDEGNNILLYTFRTDGGVGGQTGLQRTCNQYCADSRECAAGYTCFYNRCRRPDNPDSTTCSAVTTQVSTSISRSCNQSCSTNRDCANNLRCYQGTCRLATNLSSLSCSPATAGVISKGTPTKFTDQKGAEPTASPLPASPSGSLRPVSSPMATTPPSPALINTRTQEDQEESWFTRFLTEMQARGISIPVIAVGLGLLLFLLALVLAIFGRGGRRQQVTIHRPEKFFPQQSELQQKIDALKAQTSTATKPHAPLPAAPPVSPMPPVSAGSPTVPSSSGISTPVPTASSQPPSSSSPAAEMLRKLRERGVLDQLPGQKPQAELPTAPTQIGTEKQPPTNG